MDISISLTQLKRSLVVFLHRFHVMIFVIIALGGSAVVIFLLNGIVIQSGASTDYDPNSTSASFDQATIERIEELKTRDQSGDNLDLSGRVNPFVE